MIFESLGALWAVESMRHTGKQFVNAFLGQGAVWAVELTRHP